MFASITKKQIVAFTGLALIIFIITHLAGNLWIYAGSAAFNSYAKKMAGLRPFLNFAEAGLLIIFLIHTLVTAMLVIENIRARGGVMRYAVDRPVGERSWGTRLMPYSGTYILLFVIWHLLDFTFANPHGPRSYINHVSYGLYGVVVNAFADPTHSILYIIAMCFLGLHLSHGVDSFLQTLGWRNSKHVSGIKLFSQWFALLIVIGYSSIPVYVLFVLTR